MATEYTLETSPELDEVEMLDYLAGVLGGMSRYEVPGEPVREFKREVILTVTAWDAVEEPDMTELFGVDKIVNTTFRIQKNLPRQANKAIFRDMIAASVKFLEDHPGSKALLSYQYEGIYLQRFGGEGIVLAEALRDPYYNYEGILDDLLANYPVRDLGRVDDLIPDD